MGIYPLAQEVISKHYCPPTVVVRSLDSRCPSSGEGDEVHSDVSHQSRGALQGTALPLQIALLAAGTWAKIVCIVFGES
ncbi:hypothetical protein CEXT_474461 [Caerostris extrusa]|uniref:Uncharacterized protein n=1 Tax=Caerostris extrusa TaxID=172846 RepID=A0AAV4UYC9_CAEEX|nr:hypothetical protein CEXT_474461 [Caerostris extrusa]